MTFPIFYFLHFYSTRCWALDRLVGVSMSHWDKTNLYYHFSQVRVSSFLPQGFLFLKTAEHGTEMILSMSYTFCLKTDDFFRVCLRKKSKIFIIFRLCIFVKRRNFLKWPKIVQKRITIIFENNKIGWVWENKHFIIMSPPFRVGRHIVFHGRPSVCLSICPSVCHKSCPLCNLKTA